MILTVTCNPAVDLTYRVDSFEPGAVHRVTEVDARPGGKGINVARVLHQLDEPVIALTLGNVELADRLEDHGVPAEVVGGLAEVRRTVVIHATETTSLWEPGSRAMPEAADLMLERLVNRLPSASVVVVSGSLPPGLTVHLPLQIAKLARKAGVPVVLDVDDNALRSAVDNAGAILTPNLEELARLVGPVTDPGDAAASLARRTGAPVVVTCGADGLVGADGRERWHVAPPAVVSGNPTGAGDATAAGIARGLAHGWSWPETLRHAAALGTAAVLVPTAGEVDLAAYHSFVHPIGTP